MTFHSIMKQKYSCWNELEHQLEQISSQKEKGDVFEEFAFAYFTYFRDLYQIDLLFSIRDLPDIYKTKYKLEKRDNGVDGLFIKKDGTAVAYQVKFRSGQESPTYEELATFWAESEHTDERCIFANCYQLPKQAAKKKNQFTILEDCLDVLDENFFLWLYDFTTTGDAQHKTIKFTPFPYQQKMIDDVLAGWANYNRGKLLAACGAGKTLISLWIKERTPAKKILFVTPSITLIKQALSSWMSQAKAPFRYLCVCSDETVADPAQIDGWEDDLNNLGIPVTTQTDKIVNFLQRDTQQDMVIFSTYQSLDSIVAALQICNTITFDIAFFDEAHRTAGNKDSQMFILGMDDNIIPCKKRLFMTATERFVNPRIANRAKELHYEVFSMDRPEQYGPTFTSLSFRDAIEQGIISDYKIVLSCMKEGELKQLIKQNRIIQVLDRKVDAQNLFKQILLAKAMESLGIHKVITYHRNIDEAQRFILPPDGAPLAEIIADLSTNVEPADVYAAHINGRFPMGARQKIFHSFAQAPYGVLSNARCLTEGVDLPIVDAVYFADPKNSMIDIVQAVGRCLRKGPAKPDKISYIIIPIIIPEQVSRFTDIDPEQFATLHAVIQALRDQDRILADYVDKLNLQVAKGTGKITNDPNSPLLIQLSEDLDFEDFSESVNLRIAQVNKEPNTLTKEFVVGSSLRTSGTKRVFRTVGDYTVDSYYNTLIAPTLQKYSSPDIGLTRQSLSPGHNHVSHCVKIGALIQKSDRFYMTEVGKTFCDFPQRYRDIFKEQLLKYHEKDAITRLPKFPYRMILSVLEQVGSLSKFEFIYSLYINKEFGQKGIQSAVERVEYLRNLYPNIAVLSQQNKMAVQLSLNAKFNTTLTFNDIWTARTTVNNQFKYIKEHLSAWDKIFDPLADKDKISLLPGGQKAIHMLLDRSAEIETCPQDQLETIFISYQGY